jgi:hypothetical protein
MAGAPAGCGGAGAGRPPPGPRRPADRRVTRAAQPAGHIGGVSGGQEAGAGLALLQGGKVLAAGQEADRLGPRRGPAGRRARSCLALSASETPTSSAPVRRASASREGSLVSKKRGSGMAPPYERPARAASRDYSPSGPEGIIRGRTGRLAYFSALISSAARRPGGRGGGVETFAVEGELGDLGVQRRDHGRGDVHGRVAEQDRLAVEQQGAALLLVGGAHHRVELGGDAVVGLLLGGLDLALALLALTLEGVVADLQVARTLLEHVGLQGGLAGVDGLGLVLDGGALGGQLGVHDADDLLHPGVDELADGRGRHRGLAVEDADGRPGPCRG